MSEDPLIGCTRASEIEVSKTLIRHCSAISACQHPLRPGGAVQRSSDSFPGFPTWWNGSSPPTAKSRMTETARAISAWTHRGNAPTNREQPIGTPKPLVFRLSVRKRNGDRSVGIPPVKPLHINRPYNALLRGCGSGIPWGDDCGRMGVRPPLFCAASAPGHGRPSLLADQQVNHGISQPIFGLQPPE